MRGDGDIDERSWLLVDATPLDGIDINDYLIVGLVDLAVGGCHSARWNDTCYDAIPIRFQFPDPSSLL